VLDSAPPSGAWTHTASVLDVFQEVAGLAFLLKNGRAKAVRFSTLEAMCRVLGQLGPRARAATASDAAAVGDIVVVTVPLRAYREVPVEPLQGKVVIDTNNYYPDRDGHISELDDESTTTSELLQQHLPQSQVVKAFNNIYVSHLATLARPAGDGERTALPIAGDDAAAKDVVAAFLDAIGYEAYDVGPLSQGWRYQRETAAYVQPYAAPGTSYPDWSGRPVTAQMLKEKLDAAVRYRDM